MSKAMPFGNDGAFVEDDCHVFNYARQLLRETDCPTVIIPCVIDREPNLFVTGFTGTGEFMDIAMRGESVDRATAYASLCLRAHDDVKAINRDPNHPARSALNGN